MAFELYNRTWSINLGGEQWTTLRVVFEVNRNLRKQPDPAQITVYNLPQKDRSNLTSGQELRLVAGYQETAGLLYSGTITAITPQRDGPDYGLSFTLRDGDAAYQRTIRQSYSAGAPLSVVVGNLVSAMGLGLTAGAAALLEGKATRGPLVHVGYARDKLEQVLLPWALRYTIADGMVSLLPFDSTTAEEAILLSPQTGLVGFPEPMTDQNRPKSNNVTQLRLTSLLQPGFMPGRRVVLQGVPYAGVYRVDRLIHKGDSHGQEWYSVAECSAVAGARVVT